MTGALLALDVGETIPHDVSEHDTLQVTPALFGSFVTVAVNCFVIVAITVGLCGSTSTRIAGTVTSALATASAFATEVAVTVICTSLAGGAAAVKIVATPLTVEVGDTPPHGADEQETAQVTPRLLLSFTSVAVRFALWVPSTVGDAGETVIATEGTSRAAEADLVASVTDVPVRVTVILLAGGVAGAL